MPTTMHECMDSPPATRQNSRFWLIIFLLALMYYFLGYVHFTDSDDIMRDMKKMNFNRLQRGEVPCAYNCNFDSLSKKMRDKIVETFKDISDRRPSCKVNKLGLGKLEVNNTLINVTLTRTLYPMIKLGGHYVPSDCQVRHKVAVIVPYRGQKANLDIFIFNLHPFLMNQGIEYRIFIIEQSGKEKLNTGRLFNAGYQQAKRFSNWTCLVFHDLNLLPLDARILYTCPTFPRHMSATVLGHQNDSKYAHFGGVVSMTEQHFLKVNGYSNVFWGCCGISSDMFWRIRLWGLRVVRYDKNIAKYLALPNTSIAGNSTNSSPRVPASQTATPLEDGLTTVRYKVLTIRLRPLFTHIIVDVNPSSKEPIIFNHWQ